MKLHYEIELENYPDEIYENIFSGFTKQEQIIIQECMDKFIPINDDDWLKN